MRTVIKSVIVAVFAMLVFTGCQMGAKNLVTTEIKFRIGTNELSVVNPKDTSWDDLMVSPSDGTVRIKKYRSSANEAAIAAAERQAEAQVQMFQSMKEQFERGIDIAARMYGLPVQNRAPTTIQAPPPQFSPTNTVTK